MVGNKRIGSGRQESDMFTFGNDTGFFWLRTAKWIISSEGKRIKKMMKMVNYV